MKSYGIVNLNLLLWNDRYRSNTRNIALNLVYFMKQSRYSYVGIKYWIK